MSLAPSPLKAGYVRSGTCCLAPFEPSLAATVAGWAQTAQELFWLAPKTPPPLTPAKVVAWAGPESSPMLLFRDGTAEPLGYLELNPMPLETGHFWLGHCVLHPNHRSVGLGRRMIGLALDLAFGHRRAKRVSLVVFPDNAGAIRCYRNAGLVGAGDQIKYFQTTGRQHRMLQMTIDRGRYTALKAAAQKM